MRLKLSKVVVAILLLAGSVVYGRPQQIDVSTARVQSKAEVKDAGGPETLSRKPASKELPRIIEDNSRVPVFNTAPGEKNLPDIKLSMRTVATQLLNVSDPNGASKSMADSQKDSSETKKLVTVAKIEKSADGVEKFKIEDKDLLIKEINSEITSLESIGVSFGRPTNSKFGYFETSHPGQAMALTDEELEREMSSRRDGSLYKKQPTTSGGISTWILLNPPTTTPTPTQKESKVHEMTNKFTTKPTASIQRVEIKQKVDQKPTAVVEKVIPNPHSTVKVTTSSQVKPVVKNTPKPILLRHTLAPQTVQTNPTTPKTVAETPVATVEANNSPVTERTSMTTTKKIVETQKPMTQRAPVLLTTTQKPIEKIVKPNTNRGKFSARTTTTTVKPLPTKQEIVTTPKVERVTFKPIQMIPTPKDESKSEESPLQTKPKKSIPTGTPKIGAVLQTKTTTPQPRETTTIVKTDFTGSDLLEVPMQIKPSMTKVNNVLKVQLKKPVEESIRVSANSTKSDAAAVKIEKPVAEEAIDHSSELGISQAVKNSQFEVKFDFNPELTKIAFETSTKEPEVLTTTTTKKPRRNSQKRRKNKNKNRKRKQPATTTESNEIPVISESNVTEIAAQESKVEPETKESTPVIKTNNKKKEVQKPIGTQIYNFLSREIMPSFGVVSLVGLGLGLASYFLYPFGGGIARRNYEVEPNYKYNLGEYGGNYGQSEEEVFSKVIQGMTNHEDKYGVGFKDYDLQNNYHRYQKLGSPIITDARLSKKTDQRYSPSTLASAPTYDKPFENSYELEYRNTEFKYPEVSTTSNYFERQKQSAYMVSNEGDVDRQFVVGNVPKEYGYDETPIVGKKTQTYADGGEIIQTQFEQDQNHKLQKLPADVPVLPTYGQPETLSLKSSVNYDSIEITPTAVAVEHGPRALKVKRSIDEKLFRFYPTRYRRESVIQVIPHSGSQEVEEKEEDLSNEIFGILDSMIPDKDENRKVKDKKVSNAIDNEEKINKKRDEANTQLHEITTAKIEFELKDTAKIMVSTVKPMEASPTTTTQFEKLEITSLTSAAPTEDPTTSPQSKDISTDDTIQTEGQELEETTAESNDSTTTTEKTEKEAEQGFNLFNFVKKVAEIKFRLGLTILKHASEGFARYLGGVQKRINGEE
ncbi:mucin-17-like [Athalia rosae]|uniref:mucin-17-like n=1 Tax=Athalia rosae TaxID=37344 RepID=UPI002033F542|nr:mucin-17-like [Athalia rosae]XP_025602738.2 mucin-17-like [Athalia rosae]